MLTLFPCLAMLVLFSLEMTLPDFAAGIVELVVTYYSIYAKVARDSGWDKDLINGTEGEVLRLDASQEDLTDASVPPHGTL